MKNNHCMIDRKTLFTLVKQDLESRLNKPLPNKYGEISFDPTLSGNSTDTEFLRATYQLDALWRKESNGDVSSRLKHEASISFSLCEELNASTNMRFRKGTHTRFIRGVLTRATHLVHNLLPPITEDVMDQVLSGCNFGPGSVFHAKTPFDKSILRKIGGPQSITPAARELLPSLKESFPRWFNVLEDGCQLVTVQGNRIAYVPKDISKCRTIAVEPSLNVFIQKGIGSYLERRLWGWKIDLRNQERNRLLAKEASISLTMGTLDLSDASSLISKELVRELLPPDWYALLDTARSHHYFSDGNWRKYEGFSSQGNAFTFPLETIIFYALCVGAIHQRFNDNWGRDYPYPDSCVSVYGDDIVIPSDMAGACISALHGCGLRVNRAKSFYQKHIPFRESCGGDYVRGVDVRPFFYKEDARRYSDVAKVHNCLFEKWGNLPLTLSYLSSLVPDSKRLVGPAVVWSDSQGGKLENAFAINHTSYFWVRDADLPVQWNKDIQDFVFKGKAWGLRSKKIDKGLITNELAAILAFLLAGSDSYDSLPLSVPITRTVAIPISAVRAIQEELIR